MSSYQLQLPTLSPWNPRYEQYCLASGFTPETCPDPSMAEFIIWSCQQLVKARKQHPEFFMCGSLADHEGYDAWLVAEVAKAGQA